MSQFFYLYFRLIEFDLVIYLGGIYVKVIDSSIEQPIDDVECVDFKITVITIKVVVVLFFTQIR